MSNRIESPDTSSPILVAGAGGFIGGWLVRSLQEQGFSDIRAVDLKPLSDWYQVFDGVENHVADLQLLQNCRDATAGRRFVFNLAADMGGMGFIEANKALCMLSVLINTHLLEASREVGVERFFFASSACVYNAEKQNVTDVVPLREADAYPAMPEDGYGWEKLFSERMVRHFDEDFGIAGRVARYHNVYGPHGTWDGGREKAPAALARKVALAKLTGDHTIQIWGDGEQTRSFTFIDDAIYGTEQLFWSEFNEPLNIGSEEMVSINQMVDILEDIAGIKLTREYQLDAPKGVRGRNSDNTLVQSVLGWKPSHKLSEGLASTYAWISNQLS
ncbi:NAD-dependent epimerase/dehydratase family protein [Pontimonas sp.]|nr:NAD-dependent epimerase/dehydratase family protein [Pontimonas sp.]